MLIFSWLLVFVVAREIRRKLNLSHIRGSFHQRRGALFANDGSTASSPLLASRSNVLAFAETEVNLAWCKHVLRVYFEVHVHIGNDVDSVGASSKHLVTFALEQIVQLQALQVETFHHLTAVNRLRVFEPVDAFFFGCHDLLRRLDLIMNLHVLRLGHEADVSFKIVFMVFDSLDDCFDVLWSLGENDICRLCLDQAFSNRAVVPSCHCGRA